MFFKILFKQHWSTARQRCLYKKLARDPESGVASTKSVLVVWPLEKLECLENAETCYTFSVL